MAVLLDVLDFFNMDLSLPRFVGVRNRGNRENNGLSRAAITIGDKVNAGKAVTIRDMAT